MLPGFEPPYISSRGEVTDSGLNLSLACHLALGVAVGAVAAIAARAVNQPVFAIVAAWGCALCGAAVVNWFLPFTGMALVGSVKCALTAVAFMVVVSTVLGPRTRSSAVITGCLFAVMPIGFASGWAAARARLRSRRPLFDPGCCEFCGYNSARSERCPECGRQATR